MTTATPVTFTQEQTALGDYVWTMRCDHGQVTSMEAFSAYSKELVAGCFLFWSEEMPSALTDELVAMIAVRNLLARLLELRFDCPCGLVAFQPSELPGAIGEGRPS